MGAKPGAAAAELVVAAAAAAAVAAVVAAAAGDAERVITFLFDWCPSYVAAVACVSARTAMSNILNETVSPEYINHRHYLKRNSKAAMPS